MTEDGGQITEVRCKISVIRYRMVVDK
jgi:hypothetical protein